MSEERNNNAIDIEEAPAAGGGASSPQADERAAAANGGGAAVEDTAAAPPAEAAEQETAQGTAEEEEVDELAATAAERDQYLALAQRTQADFENYRKRAAREALAAEGRGLTRLARELVPALDNLDRALVHATEGADVDEALVEGLRMVQRELFGALERVGISTYGSSGERFDPELHEAVAQQPSEHHEPGQIVEVYQSGYRHSDGGVIRAARVLVAG